MRRRSSAPGRRGPDGRKFLVGLLLLTVAVGACGEGTATNPLSVSDGPGATDGATPSGTAETPAGSSGEPTDNEEPATAEPGSEAPSTTPGASTASPGDAAPCSGSDENRDFFASMAAAVDWTVYCPVLPDGWFVDDGQYRLAGGGWMRISYRGPGDARLLLQQGAFCEESESCVPGGQDVGETAFGDRTGVLVAGDDATWSTAVDRGAAISWLLTVTGLDEATARTISADLQPVGS